MKHTNGPWKIKDIDPNWIYKGAHLICKVTDSNGDKNITDRNMANAQLIASAPELLEALEHLIHYDFGDSVGAIKARNAIKKAKGEK